MSWRPSHCDTPTVWEGVPGDAKPGDELLWLSEGPAGCRHHAIEVGLVVHDPECDRVRIHSGDGTGHDFADDQVVALIRGVDGLRARSRASDPAARPSADHPTTMPRRAKP